MALVEQVRSVRIAEVELVVEIHSARHHVLGERVCRLELEAIAKPPLPLNEQRIVMVDAGSDQRIDLAKGGC